jgi:hypothetical protein
VITISTSTGSGKNIISISFFISNILIF